MVNRDSRNPCSKMPIIDERIDEAHPGIARLVKDLIPITTKIIALEKRIKTNDRISNRLATSSRNTEIAPNPCNTSEIKFIFDESTYRAPLSDGTAINGSPDLITAADK